MKTIKLKIDVSKIDKAKLYKGAKGTYLDAVLFLKDEVDQYGNHGMIVQSVTKEEREQGVKGAILGNAQLNFAQQPVQEQQQEDDLPF
jgi:hypothetical protein